jgi:FkbM family methyltransferase
VSYNCAVATVGLNGLSNVELENAALGEESRKVSLEVRGKHGEALGGKSAVLAGAKSRETDTIEVPLRKIDGVIPEQRTISILQLDVEGAERQALEGGLETIRRWKPILILENLPAKDWMREHIFSLGYEHAGRVHSNKILKV